MEEAINYQNEVELIDSADAGSVSTTETIDVNRVLANRLEVKKPSYSEIVAMVDRVESRRPILAPSPEAQAQPGLQPQPQEITIPRQELGREKSSAAEKLRSIVGGAGKESEQNVSVKPEEAQEGSLVMPQLSLQDQLADLEKIEEGLGEKAFNSEQLDVIKQEIKALSARAAHADVKKMSPEQREVATLVNRRVKEIKAELNIR